MTQYVFHGGGPGRERLRVLARVVAPSTLDLFSRIGVSTGWRCLDVGCGGGDAALELARLVDPAIVTGLDVDESQLDIARQEAEEAGIENVDYRLGDAVQPDDWLAMASIWFMPGSSSPTYRGRRPCSRR